MNQKETATLINAIQDNRLDLGLSWELRPGTVDRVADGITYVRLDGAQEEDDPNEAVPLGSQVGAGLRVMNLITSPTSMYIISSSPSIGSPVVRLRREADQSIANGGTGTFIAWDVLDLDVFGVVDIASTPNSWLPPVPGWYLVSGRGVFDTNATSRRAYFINTNNTTAAPGTVCGTSVQTPAAGSCQVGASGIVYLNGSTDFIGARVIQNSGGLLNITNTDGGSVFEAIYLGGPMQ